MTNKHTPGPWHTEGGHIIAGAFRVARVDNPDDHGGVDWEEADANGKLISMAPKLLEVLQEFSKYVHTEQCSTDGAVTYSNTQINRLAFLARDAIAKATGEF
jgi:hypothetical protein